MPHYVAQPPGSQAIIEADEDEAGGGRAPGHVVLVGDVCRERDADGIAHLIDDEILGVQRRETRVARALGGRVTGDQRHHAPRHRVAEHQACSDRRA